MIQKFVYSSGFLAACSQAAIISGKATDSATMLYSLDARVLATANSWLFPGAKNAAGTLISDTAKTIKWEIMNLSYVDEDTGF